ncbi:MAG TPA: hypothetical protein VLT33_11465 [Labilithrix sp.]|nr:hypothetical protein [Labilithrix sp.]
MRRSLASLAVMLAFVSCLLATSKARDPHDLPDAMAPAPPPRPESEGDAAGFAVPPPPRAKEIVN